MRRGGSSWGTSCQMEWPGWRRGLEWALSQQSIFWMNRTTSFPWSRCMPLLLGVSQDQEAWKLHQLQSKCWRKFSACRLVVIHQLKEPRWRSTSCTSNSKGSHPKRDQEPKRCRLLVLHQRLLLRQLRFNLVRQWSLAWLTFMIVSF